MELAIIQLIVILGVLLIGYISVNEFILKIKKEKEYKGNSLVDGTWICKECGAFNAPYLKRCGKCFNIKNKKNEK